MTDEQRAKLLELAEMVDNKPGSIVVCDQLSVLEGFRVSFDRDGDYRFWKWGNEFYSGTQKQVSKALRALVSQNEGTAND